MARKSARPRRTKSEEAAAESAGPQGQGGHGFAPSGPSISKSAAVRAAVDAGAESPEDGVAFIKAHYGLEISKTHFSAAKSKYKSDGAPRKGTRGRKPKAVEGILSAPKRARSANGHKDLLAAIEAIKPLVDSLGVERVKKIAELLG